MKRDSRFFKQLKLKLSSTFKKKNRDDGVSRSGPFLELDGDYGKAEDLANVWSLDKTDSSVADCDLAAETAQTAAVNGHTVVCCGIY